MQQFDSIGFTTKLQSNEGEVGGEEEEEEEEEDGEFFSEPFEEIGEIDPDFPRRRFSFASSTASRTTKASFSSTYKKRDKDNDTTSFYYSLLILGVLGGVGFMWWRRNKSN